MSTHTKVATALAVFLAMITVGGYYLFGIWDREKKFEDTDAVLTAKQACHFEFDVNYRYASSTVCRVEVDHATRYTIARTTKKLDDREIAVLEVVRSSDNKHLQTINTFIDVTGGLTSDSMLENLYFFDDINLDGYNDMRLEYDTIRNGTYNYYLVFDPVTGLFENQDGLPSLDEEPFIAPQFKEYLNNHAEVTSTRIPDKCLGPGEDAPLMSSSDCTPITTTYVFKNGIYYKYENGRYYYKDTPVTLEEYDASN